MTINSSIADLEISLRNLYGNDQEVIAHQKNRYKKLSNDFENIFGSQPEKYFSSPGRVEISGNHTDHNHGKVIAASINLDAIAAASPSNNNSVVLYSDQYSESYRRG